MRLRKPVTGLVETPTVRLEDLEALEKLVDVLASAKLRRMERDVRLGKSLHTFYGDAPPVVPGSLSRDAMRKFGERVRLV